MFVKEITSQLLPKVIHRLYGHVHNSMVFVEKHFKKLDGHLSKCIVNIPLSPKVIWSNEQYYLKAPVCLLNKIC